MQKIYEMKVDEKMIVWKEIASNPISRMIDEAFLIWLAFVQSRSSSSALVCDYKKKCIFLRVQRRLFLMHIECVKENVQFFNMILFASEFSIFAAWEV